MLGWYCDWGYLTTSPGTKYPTNLSDVTFVDFNRLFTIGTIYNADKLPIYPNMQDVEPVPGSMMLKSLMGSDYETLYCAPSYLINNVGNGSIATSLIPQIFNSCPTLIELKVGTSSKWACCYIRSLNRLITWGVGSSYGNYIYSVADDGSLSHITHSNSENATITYCGVDFAYYIFVNHEGDNDLSNCLNYVRVKANLGTYRFRSFYVEEIYNTDNPRTSLQSTLTALFAEKQTPDVIGSGNPYDPIDPSGPTDPDAPPGDFDDESDPIPDSPIPTLSSANTGFTRIYNPTLAQVRELANYLWTDETVISTIWNHIKQYFEDPMQAIIGFNLVPVPVPDGGIEEFKLMYIGTGVNMTVAASQFVDIDCGTLELKPYYGSYLDYAPYTKISCFLPYIGNVEINPDEVMNTTLQVKYRVDICSGSCVAKILVDNNCLYQYSGHCAIPIPFASADFSSYVSAAISVAKLGVGVATAGALGAAGLEAGEVAQATTAVTTTNTERNPATGRQITMNTQTVSTESSRETKPSPASYAGITPRNVSNTVGQIMGSKPAFQHSGSFSGNTGYLGVRRPFLIITRPNLCLPESYKAMNGYPAMITMNLSDCTGFTQVQQIQFSGSSATNPEVDEILQFLKSGVIF